MNVNQRIEPLVSVIITTFNGSEFISETIASVICQTYSNWELIVIDDGSTDNTREIVKSVCDERINMIEAGRIGRNGRVKNLAIAHCKGQLIAFLDHDDLWHPEKLEKQVEALRKNFTAGFCLTGGYNFTAGKESRHYFYSTQEGTFSGNLLELFFQSRLAAWTQALLIRRSCIEMIGGFNEEKVFADPDYIVNVIAAFDGIILYEPLVFRRLHETNYSTDNWLQGQEDGLEIINRFRNHGKLKPSIVRFALFKYYLHFGEKLMRNKQRAQAIRKFMSAWRYEPTSIVPLKKIFKAIFF